MGSEEKTVEPAEEPSQKGQGSPEKETSSSADHLEGQASQSTVPLNTYKWQTGSKGSLHEVVEDGTTEKIQKGNKWSKMQTWRKALSEDPEDKTTKMNSMRKNPFRRAFSSPPAALFATLTHSSVSVGASAPTEAGWDTSTDPQQEGGGARLKKYWRSVSQKLKRPKLLSRNSAPFLRPGLDEGEHEVEHHKQQWVPPQEVPLWNISNCVLEDGQILISPEEEPTMWTRTRVSSCLSSLSMQNLVDMETECSPDNLGPRPKKEDGGVKALIKRRLESKAKRNSNTQVNPMGLHKRSRQYGSRESVSIPVCPVGSLDLSADASTVVRPVHSSILGEKYCFEVINSESTHCFGCSSAAERDRWIEDLRRAAQPNKDNTERTENSLSLWVNEAKDLPPKRRYYCEIHLDGTLFARSTSKVSSRSHLAGDSSTGSSGHLGGNGGGTGGFQLFWGEFFELDNLPCISQITLHLFCEEDSKKKRHSGEVFSPHLLGSVDIRLAEIRGRTYQEKWYPIIPYKVSATACSKELLGPQASLRIKARFQNLQVLPMEKYKEFAEYVTVDYEDMCKNLEPLLNVKEKEELAGALVHVLQSIGKAKEFLVDLAKAEVERLGEKEALIFRENSLATKAIDEYMKLVGQKYLIDTLGDNCEVNPRKCHASELSNNQKHLREVCDEAVRKITDLHGHFPEELNKIFSSWTEMCEDQGRPEIGQRLIFASLFLRFLCPAVLSPSLFGLTQSYPESNTLRTLTLTAKVIQNLANFTLFGEKEEYMLFMNEFLQQHWDRMRGFLQTVSDPCTEIPMSSFDGYVDLPLQLAVLHGLLVDIIHQRAQETIEKLHPLPWILNQITESLGPEIPQITINSPRRQVKPMYIPPKHLSKYSPHQSSLQQLPQDSKGLINSVCEARRRKPVTRTQSAPYRRPEKRMKRHTSSEALPTADHEQDLDTSQPLISSPKASESSKPCAPVPWIKDIQKREPSEMKLEHEGLSLLDRHTQELSELRLGVDQVTERELEMAKRLEDFIIQSLDQHAMLQAEVNEIRNLLAVRDEQLASATFRLGVIEEERENDERKMNVATAAAERMNTLEEQFVDLMKDLHRVNEAYNSIVQAVEKQPV